MYYSMNISRSCLGFAFEAKTNQSTMMRTCLLMMSLLVLAATSRAEDAGDAEADANVVRAERTWFSNLNQFCQGAQCKGNNFGREREREGMSVRCKC